MLSIIITWSKDKARYGALKITQFALCNTSMYLNQQKSIQLNLTNVCMASLIPWKFWKDVWIPHIQALVSPSISDGRLWEVVFFSHFHWSHHLALVKSQEWLVSLEVFSFFKFGQCLLIYHSPFNSKM